VVILCNNATASVVTGVTGVVSISNTSPCGRALTITSCGTLTSGGGLGVSLSTLSGLNGDNPVAAHAAVIFLLVKALVLAGLYREVKCSLPTVSAPPQYNLLTWSR
jgi:hypothetical protein